MQRHLGPANIVLFQRDLGQANPRLWRAGADRCGGLERGFRLARLADLLVAFAQRVEVFADDGCWDAASTV